MFSGHKFYAPKGVGIIAIPRKWQHIIHPFIVGGDQQNGGRSGTINLASIAGMGKALEIVLSEEERRKMKEIRSFFVENLSKTPNITEHSLYKNNVANIFCFRKNGISSKQTHF